MNNNEKENSFYIILFYFGIFSHFFHSCLIWINLEYKEHFKICNKNPLNNNTIKNSRKSYKIRINTSKINNNYLRDNYNIKRYQ